jgi:hypothetical protein
MVCCGFPVGRRLGDLDFSISLESHRHLRTSIIDSIEGEFAAALLTFSFVILFSAISMVKRFQFGRILVSINFRVFGDYTKLHRNMVNER